MAYNGVKPDKTETRLQGAARRWSCGETFSIGWATGCLVAVVATVAVVSVQPNPAHAQVAALEPTTPTVKCAFLDQDLVMPPEIVSSRGVLSGTILLTEEHQRLPGKTTAGGDPTCVQQLVRVFRGNGLPLPLGAQPPGLPDPSPGPTLRARVGDLVNLTFINKVDSNRFDQNLDIAACTEVGQGGDFYPAKFDKWPNCLRASSTANIHFHGTHTNPDATGDNVYLQVRPLPRDNQGKLTTTPATASVGGFPEFYKNCAAQLQNPLNAWPITWDPGLGLDSWFGIQTELLRTYQSANPGQPIWDENQAVLAAGKWPQYYIGAVPYCYALPTYTELVFPPPPGSTSPVMGQYPGTQWYHAHKHGSTAINVANGMTGAFIIEGNYDKYLDANYGSYVLEDGNWTARSQPVMVLNQLGTTPNLLTRVGAAPADFVVNGRLRPTVQMQPGEVQLWRILNTSGQSAAYFMAPEGLKWRQLAQDGVQFADINYRNSTNKPVYIAPANRVDLLVKAPLDRLRADIQIQVVMGRKDLKLDGVPRPGVVLMKVNVSGEPVTLNDVPAQMPFLRRAAPLPPYLTDITDKELAASGYIKRTLDFHSKLRPRPKRQHTINGLQFGEPGAEVRINLGAVEEWTLSNSTTMVIDHPMHIHINPFQITEVFDPNERLTDPITGKLQALPRYLKVGTPKTDPRQCNNLNPRNPATWSVAGACGPPQTTQPYLVWWDTFAIPAARLEDGKTIPGYFKMRSRFVDYAGQYVTHCHILIHEDRGMMFSVRVLNPPDSLLGH